MTERAEELKRKDEDLKVKIGEIVRHLRLERALSQEDLADETGLHTNHIGFIERGQKMPTVGALRRIARALGMRLSELLGQLGE